uniref:RNA helicase n=1 Tax=Entomoneis paludosa TaxID=265537 RepID=A0A7S3DVA0_9STRA|eukprot:CAMPEP_0172463096 /NCGR_PEP_ID=MMETSP1065-20121228/46010_1 /TAXON_ID=265537 /ORGANISM="Amphiprora paludosa, Strain CCMP125" /LENGTH=504 /DNA_ID=CAMNT_0013218959 /DNA_START=44 /DNA_END=1558 /DNA_ORIENTATION=-
MAPSTSGNSKTEGSQKEEELAPPKEEELVVDTPTASSVVTEQTFKSLGVCDALQEACERLEWKHATQIQASVLPVALKEGSDIIGLAETGSGKTGAFCLPILQGLLKNPLRATAALILTPTRELAFQIHTVVQGLGQGIGATSTCVVGGVDRTAQAIALARHPHILIATPGRLLDHLKDTKGFHLRQVRYLVLDEADRMLSMDFEEELIEILDNIPTERQTFLFSATMTSQVQKLQRASLSDPVRIEVSTKFQTPKQLKQSYLFIPAKFKDCYLTYLINEHAGKSILVFGATCNNVQRLALMLRNLGFPAVCLHGQMNQAKRLGALQKFSTGARTILLCTDVASRGLDLPSVDLVVNYDLPGHGKEYVHRVGRTARAGQSGEAVALVTQYDVEVYQRLEVLLDKKLPAYASADEETVLVLLERVNEAQRLATRELKEQLSSASGRGHGGRRKRRGGFDADGDGEQSLKRELRQGYAGGSGGSGGALPNQRGAKGKPFKKHPRRS